MSEKVPKMSYIKYSNNSKAFKITNKPKQSGLIAKKLAALEDFFLKWHHLNS